MTTRKIWSTVLWINVVFMIIIMSLSVVEKVPLIVRLWPAVLAILLITSVFGVVFSWDRAKGTKENDSAK